MKLLLPLITAVNLAQAFNGPGNAGHTKPAPAVTTAAPVIKTEGPSKPSEVKTEETTAAPAATTTKPAARPVPEKPKSDVTQAVMHDFTTKEDCFNGQASNSVACYTGADGMNYRYGCKKDGKVYTDMCDSNKCNPEGCQNKWKWHDEMVQQCYFDGSSYYQFECTDLSPGEEYAGAGAGGKIEGTSSKTCGALGWAPAATSPFVCGASKIGDECPLDGAYDAAEKYCKDAGARLCTVEELEKDVTKGTGCKSDCAAIWSSTTCEGGGHKIAAGAAKCAKEHPTKCGTTSDVARPRCCADSTNSNVGSSAGLPAGYQLATAMDYPASAGACGGTASKSYSCWTNPTTGASQRFACSGDSEQVWVQSCGTDSTCASSSCTGEWFSQGEKLSRCYEASGADFLYTYTC